MKRTPLTRKTPLRSGPSRETKVLGGRARGLQQRKAAGVPDDAPRDEAGRSCVEKICPVCEKPFLAVWAQRHVRKTCSYECVAILKRNQYKDRSGARNPNFKNGSRQGVRDREGERRWYTGRHAECQHPLCPGGEADLALHHVVYAQKVRRDKGDMWDPRNSLTVCSGCHMSHHRRGTRIIPLAVLRDANFVFARDLLGTAAYDYLRRRYSGDDPRLDLLLTDYAPPA